MTAEQQTSAEMPEVPLVHQKRASPNPLAAEICLLCAGSGVFNRLGCMDCEGSGMTSVVPDETPRPH